MKKIIGLYFVYLALVWIYFSFFYSLETYSDINYGAYSHAMFFSRLPLPWLLLYILIKKGYTGSWIKITESLTRREWLRTLIFCAMLVGVYSAVQLPYDLTWYGITHWAGTSHQALGDWVYEWVIDLLLFWVMLSAGIYAARWLMKKFERLWWFVLWLAALPAALFFVYVQPVWVDPLYEDFSEMEAGPVQEAIEDFAEQSGLEDANLLQVNMSEKTDTYNAYVTGIFGNERIVLWDTMLQDLKEEEILFILAHEIGHYVYNHVFLGIAGYMVLSFFLLWMTDMVFRRVWKRMPGRPGWEERHGLKAIPVLLLIVSLLLSLTQPVSLAVSRQIETAADGYAIEHIEDLSAAVGSFTRMAEKSKTDVSPAPLIKWIRYSHPPIEERINRFKTEMQRRSP